MSFNTTIQEVLERPNELGIQLNPPATVEAIAEFEKVFEFSLSNDILNFYKFCNGFETDDDIFRVIPLEEAIEELIKYDNGVKGSEFIFA